MKLFSKYLSLSLLGVSLVSFQQNAIAEVMEEERNDPVSMAQFVTPGMVDLELSGVLGNVSGVAVEDLDFFKFFGQAGDVISIDIDGGIGGQRNVDTMVALISDGPDFTVLMWNDDPQSLDPGSSSIADSRIDSYRLEYTGVYYVGVSHYPRYFRDGGGTTNGPVSNGDYKLIISGVSSAVQVQHINISVKPGKNELSPLNPKARGRVPVALLSNVDFDPKDVDVNSLTFGHDGSEESLAKCNKPAADLNKDGVKDMICHFDNQMAEFRKGDVAGVLKGSMKDGTMIEGRGLLKVVPEKAH